LKIKVFEGMGSVWLPKISGTRDRPHQQLFLSES